MGALTASGRGGPTPGPSVPSMRGAAQLGSAAFMSRRHSHTAATSGAHLHLNQIILCSRMLSQIRSIHLPSPPRLAFHWCRNCIRNPLWRRLCRRFWRRRLPRQPAVAGGRGPHMHDCLSQQPPRDDAGGRARAAGEAAALGGSACCPGHLTGAAWQPLCLVHYRLLLLFPNLVLRQCYWAYLLHLCFCSVGIDSL